MGIMRDKTRPTRRLQFGLRTAFVLLTVGGVLFAWLGWNLHWLRARRAALGACEVTTSRTEKQAPGILPWFGEKGFDELVIPLDELDAPRPLTDGEQTRIAAVQQLFPEAKVLGRTVRRWMWTYSVVPAPTAAPASKSAAEEP